MVTIDPFVLVLGTVHKSGLRPMTTWDIAAPAQRLGLQVSAPIRRDVLASGDAGAIGRASSGATPAPIERGM